MAIVKAKDAAKMNSKEIKEKLKELGTELIKSRAINKKGGKTNLREIKKTIARLLTFENKTEKQNKQEAKK